MNTYEVTVVEQEGGPEPELRARWAVVAKYRLETLEENDGHYPEVGGSFDMLDHMSGPYFWERTDEEMENDPPTAVSFDIVSVDPAETPAEPQTVKVGVTVPF